MPGVLGKNAMLVTCIFLKELTTAVCAIVAFQSRIIIAIFQVKIEKKKIKYCPGHDIFWVDFEKTMSRTADLSSLGVPGVPWHTQILADQLTLFKPGGTDNYYWHTRIFRPSEGPAGAYHCKPAFQSQITIAFYVKIILKNYEFKPLVMQFF